MTTKSRLLVIRAPCGCLLTAMNEHIARSSDIAKLYTEARRLGRYVTVLEPGSEMPPWGCAECEEGSTV